MTTQPQTSPRPLSQNSDQGGFAMTAVWFFIGFSGRISRSQWWLGMLGVVVAMGMIIAIALSTASCWLALPFILFVPVALYALAARRLHDRGKSGWWTLAFLCDPRRARPNLRPVDGGVAFVVGAGADRKRAHHLGADRTGLPARNRWRKRIWTGPPRSARARRRTRNHTLTPSPSRKTCCAAPRSHRPKAARSAISNPS